MFFLFLAWGVYILRLNPRKRINRSFFFLCLALGIWALGFAVGYSQKSESAVLIWRQFSAFGWTGVYSILVHFLFLLTQTKKQHKKNNLLYLIHLPAVYFMLIYSWSSSEYDFVKGEFGWVNIAVNSINDYLFLLYYLVYKIISIVLIWNWRKIKTQNIRKNDISIIFITLLSTLFLGSLSGIWITSRFTNYLPQLGPLVFLLPMGAFYRAARYHDLFQRANFRDSEDIFDLVNQKNVYYHLAWAYVLSGIFSFLANVSSRTEMSLELVIPDLSKAGIIGGFGIILMINHSIKSNTHKEILNNLTLLLSIPVIALLY